MAMETPLRLASSLLPQDRSIRLPPSRAAAASSPARRPALGRDSSALFYVSSDTLRHLSCPQWPASPASRDLSSLSWPQQRLAGGRYRLLDEFPHEPRNLVTINRVKGDESVKPDRQLFISSANFITRSQNKHSAVTRGMKNIPSGRILEVIAGDGKSAKDDCGVASEFIYDKHDTSGQIVKYTGYGEEGPRNTTDNQRGEIVANNDKEISDDEEYTMDIILPKSRHRDGSIYRDMDRWWKSLFHIADRNETRLDAMALSNPQNCIIRNGTETCMKHFPRRMLQIMSLELDEFLVDGGLVELYGYIAVRDQLDPLLNYVVNFSRDDPIVVEQGSLINMTGPKRGIDMMDLSLIEYDMRIKTGEEEKDDLQLIDGASLIGSAGEWDQPITMRIPGSYGAVDITLSRFNSAVEATVEVLISEVQCSFNLSFSCLTSQLSKEIRLFHGAIAGS